jgi:hypothetical protein
MYYRGRMGLAWRPGCAGDLTRCLALLEGRCAYDRATLKRLTTIWPRLFRDAAIIVGIVEDHSAPQNRRLLAFGASVFVTDAFMARERAGEQPYVTARAIQEELEGPSPILRTPAISAAQSCDGLNLLNLHYAEATDGLGSEEQHQVRFHIFEAFLTQHRGYRIKEVLQEIWDDEIPQPYILKGWGAVRSEYASFAISRLAGEPRPYLIGLTRADVEAFPGWMATPIFTWTAPGFGFSPAEQALLVPALGGGTDRDLAQTLGLALPTIKSRWRQIYDRVAAVAPELLPDRQDGDGRRGDEKRRRLIEYLRHHLEELRS